jgi:FkbM family methyltransferase
VAFPESLRKHTSPQNIERYFGARTFQIAVAQYWKHLIRQGDLMAQLTRYFVQPGSTTVDVGASWGLFTYGQAHSTGPSGSVFSFEPNPVNRDVLGAIRDRYAGVQIFNVAASDQNGTAELVVPVSHGRVVAAQGSLSHGFSDVETEVVRVPVARLDEMLRTAERIQFMKIDVEGHERAVLQGATEILSGSRPVVLIEIEQRHLDENIEELFNFIYEFDYDLWALRAKGIVPIIEFDLERDQLDYIDGAFIPYSVGRDYVNNFLMLPRGTSHARLSPWAK